MSHNAHLLGLLLYEQKSSNSPFETALKYAVQHIDTMQNLLPEVQLEARNISLPASSQYPESNYYLQLKHINSQSVPLILATLLVSLEIYKDLKMVGFQSQVRFIFSIRP